MMKALLEDRNLRAQIVRFAIAGLAITVAASLAYWAIAEWFDIDPNLSLAITFVVFSFVSYMVHGGFSFAGHGGRDRPHVRGSRFLLVNVLGFLLNQFWVWLLVKAFEGETWWPIIPMIAVTPWLTFVAQRQWVFAKT